MYLLPCTLEGIPEFMCGGFKIKRKTNISEPGGYRNCPPGRYSDSLLGTGLSGSLGTAVKPDAIGDGTSGWHFQNKTNRDINANPVLR